ncbi:COP23 domain-containing protein [Cylindrospermopsis raciborskii]|nr:COP23 domain-containing protein [Cylindrospermopsis raciborskii]NLQ04568.1 hypothetical protein [Cylindrospermopsis raciborskii MVCC19]
MMQLSLKSGILALSMVGAGVMVSGEPGVAGENKFFCTRDGGVPVTKVRTPRGNETFIIWERDFNNYPASKRCGIISNKLQRFYENGEVHFKTGIVNEYPVVCISNRQNARCSGDNLLVTLPKGEDSVSVLEGILAWRRGTSSEPIRLSQGCFVSQDTEGNTSWNLKKLVDGLCDSTAGSESPQTPTPRF